ncbi:hypothetical protein PMAYCL1PPCAC_21224, partial [Pristionchus mayeri]
FGLPVVFLRDLMKTMEIKDRLRLRLTCRSFEKLVAETHAGSFNHFAILKSPSKKTFKFLGDADFNDFEVNEDGFRQCL